MVDLFPIPTEIKTIMEKTIRDFRNFQAAGHRVILHFEPFDVLKDPNSIPPNSSWQFHIGRGEWNNPTGATDPNQMTRTPNTIIATSARVRPLILEDREDDTGGILRQGVFEIEFPIESLDLVRDTRWVEIEFLDNNANILEKLEFIPNGIPTIRGFVEANRVILRVERPAGK